MVEKSFSPFWDETLSFEFNILSEAQLDSQKAYIEVWNSKIGMDDLIGAFELDFGFLWREENHELHRRWVGLTDPLGEPGRAGLPESLQLVDGTAPKTDYDDDSDSDG